MDNILMSDEHDPSSRKSIATISEPVRTPRHDGSSRIWEMNI